MFKRRKRFTLRDRAREFFWPSMGLGRSTRYLAHRMGRLPGGASAVAAGFASGAAVSMTPLIGLHFVLAFAVAWPLRGNMVAAAVGTVVGNPWTFPGIWYLTYQLGCRVMGLTPGHGMPEQLTLAFLLEQPLQVFLPMLVGGVILAVLVWPVCYALVRPAVALYQDRRKARRAARAGLDRSADAPREGNGS